ncbi:MAG: hypothetical protein Q8R15_02305 [Candidatus Micrarchaeota archaeon]|nr:hypothetical protein [Candidatus Micrarchaeota archaeon]
MPIRAMRLVMPMRETTPAQARQTEIDLLREKMVSPEARGRTGLAILVAAQRRLRELGEKP